MMKFVSRLGTGRYIPCNYYLEDKNNISKQMLLIFSHELTDKQRKEAMERFGISKFVALDDALLDKWADVPPHLENLSDYLSDIIAWIDKNGQPGDYALVQGDYGATMFIVDFCISKDITPVYATTKRKVIEEKIGETVKLLREFEHVMFREYRKMTTGV